MSEKLTARRALLGQKGSVAAMVISSALVATDKDDTAISGAGHSRSEEAAKWGFP
jgi:hypothetical protein